MDHKIKHCNGFGCISRNNCHRYILHKDARIHDLVWMPYLHPIICIEEDYRDFIPTDSWFPDDEFIKENTNVKH